MKKTKIIFIIAIFIAFMFILNIFIINYYTYFKKNNINLGNINAKDASNISGNQKSSIVSLSLTEISKHNNEKDCWFLINNKVYDVTAYINSHPGGKTQIIKGCGKEASELFLTQGGTGSHSSSANTLLDSFYLGNLNQNFAALEIVNKTTIIKNTIISKNLDEIESEDD